MPGQDRNHTRSVMVCTSIRFTAGRFGSEHFRTARGEGGRTEDCADTNQYWGIWCGCRPFSSR